jgi:5-hydroxyisourate hydrolase
MAGLTTHVLDTSRGKPAVDLKIELYKIAEKEKKLIKTFFTNDDGRIDEPLISAANLEEINYELLFFAGDYLKKQNIGLNKNIFLDEIPIRFYVNNRLEHYHVPLLLSPFGYSTYRGS